MDEKQKEIQELRKRLRELEGYTDSKMESEVTVCMPVGPDKKRWLWQCIYALEPWAQSVPVRLHTTSHRHAPIETANLTVGEEELRSKFDQYQYVELLDDSGNRLQNICNARKALAESVTTPWLLWVDADVRMPSGGVRLLLDEIKQDKDCGFLGIQYTFEVDHVQNGCTIMPTDLAKKLSWKPDRCSCWSAIQEMIPMGYNARHLQGITACHISLEKYG